ncbi:hypothetical protein G7046_g5318 [Stylonectria norvegica]|nr:hypothetical protein G7046_g5318 [Stylonectria norvegica]
MAAPSNSYSLYMDIFQGLLMRCFMWFASIFQQLPHPGDTEKSPEVPALPDVSIQRVATRRATGLKESPSHPGLDAIRGGNLDNVLQPLRPRLPTDLTALPTPLEPREYREYMLEYLARLFGPQGDPASFDDELRSVGSRFDSSRQPSRRPTHEHTAEPIVDESLTHSPPSSPSISTALVLNCEVHNQPAQSAEVSPVERNHRTKSRLRREALQKQHDEAEDITLSYIRDTLIPKRGCDSRFFPSCSEKFLSDSKIWSFLTEARVRSLLNKCELGDVADSEKDDLARTICGMPSSRADTDFTSYRKVLLILILIRRHDQIRRFVDQQLDDKKLPLRINGHTRSLEQPGLPDSNTPHPCFEDWDSTDIGLFETYQMQVTAPYFKHDDGKCHHYRFPDKTALPFLSEGGKTVEGADKTALPFLSEGGKVAEGAFAEVMKVELPEAHGNLRSYTKRKGSKKQVFAVKRLKSPNREAFEDESNILGRLNSIAKHHQTKHLATLSATFEIQSTSGPTFYFIFPCADFNLVDFWKHYSKSENAEHVGRFSKWMAVQFHGLSQALEVLHNFSFYRKPSDLDPRNWGIHGDIKPKNILCFRNWNGHEDEFGMLQLADFGLTQYHHTVTVNQVSPLVRSHAYCPPEVELLWKTGQPLDIWALGCLFLEFSVWLVFGESGLKTFMKDRKSESLQRNLVSSTFYDINQTYFLLFNNGLEVSISTGVLHWVEKVHQSRYTPRFVHEIMDLVLQDMLVLQNAPVDASGEETRIGTGAWIPKPIKDLWKSKVKLPQRIGATELMETLENILQNDDAYFQEPSQYNMSSFVVPHSVQTSTTEAKIKQLAIQKSEKRRIAVEPRLDVGLRADLRRLSTDMATVRSFGSYDIGTNENEEDYDSDNMP